MLMKKKRTMQAKKTVTKQKAPAAPGIHVEHFEKGVIYSEKDLLVLARKIGKLATYCKFVRDEASSIRVESESRDTKKASDEVKVMITVRLPHKVLRADSRKGTALEALDRTIEKLEPQLVKYKEMHTGKGRTRRGTGN